MNGKWRDENLVISKTNKKILKHARKKTTTTNSKEKNDKTREKAPSPLSRSLFRKNMCCLKTDGHFVYSYSTLQLKFFYLKKRHKSIKLNNGMCKLELKINGTQVTTKITKTKKTH